jgi:hypothetical protein
MPSSATSVISTPQYKDAVLDLYASLPLKARSR